MNEEAIRDAYDYFYRTGYDGNIGQFIDLLNTNKEAVQDVYNYFLDTGYEGNINEFKSLLGIQPVKKKETSVTFGPSLEIDSQFKSKLGPEFDQDDQEYAEYLDRKNKEAVKALKDIRPDLDFPTKEEYYGVDKIPEFTETSVFKDMTDISAGEKKAMNERARIAQEYIDGKRELTPQQALVNTLSNSLGRLITTDDKIRYLYGIVTDDMKQLGLAEKEQARIDSYRGPVSEFTKVTELFSSGLEDPTQAKKDAPKVRKMFGTALLDAISSVVVSRLQQRVPGVGPFLLASDMIGESIRSFNKEKAKSNKISEAELYESGEAEIAFPGIVGFFSYEMEKFGLGKISKFLSKLPKSVYRFFARTLYSMGAEGLTEGGQFIAEELNRYIGSQAKVDGKEDLSGVGEKFAELIKSREFREAIYKGVAGGGGAYAGGTAYRAMAGVKTDEQIKKQDEAYEKLLDLEDARQKTKLTPEQNEAFETAEESAKKDIKDIDDEAAETLNNLEEDQVSEIEKLQEEQQSLNNMLLNTVASENLTEEQKDIVIGELQKKFKENLERVKEIKKQSQEKTGDTETTQDKKVDEEPSPVKESFDITDENDVKAAEQKYDSTTESDKFRIIESAKRVQAALSNVFSDLNIVLHDTSDSFLKNSGARQAGRGAFNKEQNTIHINLEQADRTTLAHESFHAMLRNTINRGKWEAETKKMFESVLPDIKGTALEKELEDFISNYDSNVQNEERLTQLFARFAESETQFKATTKQKVKDWINTVARSINMNNIFTDKDIQDLEVKRVLNTLAGKITTGQEIEALEVAKLDSEVREKLIKGQELDHGQVIGGVKVKGDTETNGKDIALQLVDRLGVETSNIKRGTIADIDGSNAFVFAADQAVVGTIKSPTGVNHEFMGGFLYPYLENTGGWAFTDQVSAKKVLKKVQDSDGVGLVMVQAPKGIIGSNSFQDYALKEIDNAISKGADPKYFVDRANEILQGQFKKAPMTSYMSKQGLPTSVKNVEDLKTLLPYTGDKKASYEARGNFYSKMFNAGTEEKTGIPRFEFGDVKEKINQYGGIAMTDIVNDPALKSQEYGDVVSAIQFDKNSSIIDTRNDNSYKTHPSYPFVIEGKPIMVFNQGYDVRKLFPDFKAKPTKKQPDPKPLSSKAKPQAARSAMGGQPISQIKTTTPEVSEVALQKIDNGLSKASGTTQVATTVGSYKKVANKINKGTVLDYGAGLGLGTDAMTSVVGRKVDSYELNTERWKGKNPVTYTEASQITKKYDNIVSLNVLNVVPKNVRDFIVDHIGSILNEGGTAFISTRKFSGDINKAKNFIAGPEDKSLIIKRKQGGAVIDVFQKGFDGNELIDYVQDRLGNGFIVEKDNSFGSSGVIVTKPDVAMQKVTSETLDQFQKDSDNYIKNLESKRIKRGFRSAVWNAVFDRQSDLKKLFSQKIPGAQDVVNAIVTKAGAQAYQGELFKNARKKIYDGLTKETEGLLNQVIFAQRIVSINKKLIEKQAEAAQYEKEYGKTISKSKAKNIDKDVLNYYYDLVRLKEDGSTLEYYKIKDFTPYTATNSKDKEFGAREAQLALDNFEKTDPKLYNDLNEKAQIYFDEYRNSLTELYNSGRINKGTYEYFRDVNYSPIRVLEKIFKDNRELTQGDIDKTAALYGLPAKDIMALSNKNENTILMDSRWLLAMTMAATQRKRFNNLLMNKIYKTVQSAPEAFQDFVTLNKKEAEQKGFVPVAFYVKGDPQNIYMEEEYARQLMDIRVDDKILNGIEKFSGVKLLKFFATGGNVAFILSNAPIDLMNVALFTDVYNRTPLEKIKGVSLAKVTGDFIKNATRKMISDVRGKGKYKQLYEEFLKYGGGMDYLSQTGITKINKGRETNYDRMLGILSYLGTTSEQAVRVSVFDKAKKDRIKEYKKKNGINPVGEDLDNILFESAAQARETIDFAQGGKITKKFDKGVPYLNALVQAVRRPIDYARQKPKAFMNSIAQVIGMGAAVPALNYFLAGLMGDDEDPKEVLKELRQNSSKYEKANYYQLLNPFDLRDKEGNLNYIRIRKLPTISLISTPAEEIAFSQYTGEDVDTSTFMQSAKATIPLTGGIVDLAGSNPALSAFIAYYANYDLFRGKEIVRKQINKPMKAYAEGFEDDDVSILYKNFASLGASVGVDVSPKRMQAAIEKVITSPTTNPIIGLMYGGGEALNQIKEGGADIDFILKPLKGFYDGVSRRAYRQTNPNVKKYNDRDKVLDQIEKNNAESYLRDKRANKKFNELIKEKGVGNLPEKLPEDFKNYIKENYDKIDHKRILRKYTRRLRSSVIDGIFYDIAYERDPKNQALYLQYLYGPTMEREEYVELQKFIKTITGRKISRKALIEYRNME